MASNIQWAAPKEISFDGNVSENYRKFEEHWNLFEKTELKGKNEEERCSYLLLCIGEKGREIYRTLNLPDETTTNDDGETIWNRTTKQIKTAFKTYCNPRKNLTFERHKFNIRNQEQGETIDQYATVLRTLAASCEFKDLKDGLIRDRIVCGITNQSLRERLLREADLTLEKALNTCRASEHSKQQLKTISEAQNANVDFLQGRYTRSVTERHTPSQTRKTSDSDRKPCGNCGNHHKPRSCPAYGKTCDNCSKIGHFAKCCRSSQQQRKQPGNYRPRVHEVEHNNRFDEDYDSDYDQGIDHITIDSVESRHTEQYAKIIIDEKHVHLKLDTGAETSVLTREDFNNIVPRKNRRTKLQSSHAKLTAFGGHAIPVIGQCSMLCRAKEVNHIIKFQVVETGKSLLGCEDSKRLKLISFNINPIYATSSPTNELKGKTKDEIVSQYSECFEGLGRIAEPYHIKIDKEAEPVIHPPRKIPQALRERVKEELDSMEQSGVIEKVHEPTPWVNSMVVNEKRSGKLRICIDPRDLNKAVKREHYQLPTQEEITARLSGATLFSHLDAKSGFWQIPLDKDSSLLTTFNTPFGRYRFNVMPFGFVFAQEVFHRTVSELFADVPGCETDIDDILVWGTTPEEHDRNLKQALDRVKEINMTLNKEKCKFRQTELIYLGEKLTSSGLKADDSKIKAILEYPRPQNKQDILRLLGMVNFIAKFTPHVSDVTAPLREITKKDVEFHWSERHEKAFENLKTQLSSGETLQYYNVKKPVTMQVDASQKGLGAALYQDQGPVAYASKAMNNTQQNYAQIEKELLAIVFGCKRFHQYIYGKHVTIETDHKPLEAIFAKPLSQAPSRLQKMLLQLQGYDIDLKYKKGTEMYIADALSRAFPPEIVEDDFEREMTEEKYIHLMSTKSYVTDRKLDEIKEHIQRDENMQLLIKQIRKGWPEDNRTTHSGIKEYYPHREKLTEGEGLIYSSHAILIPPSLQKDTLKKLHQSHQGVEKTKHLARQSIFWPGMSAQIEDVVSNCSICLRHRNSNTKEPLHPHELPQRPWQRLATDLFDWKGLPHLVVVDYYSRYPEIAQLRDTKSKTVISKMKSFFSRHGIPDEVVSDNGPQYSAQEFKEFAQDYGFTHTTTSPRYPQSGGLHEKTVQTAKRILEKTKESGEDVYLALLDYRNTPINGTSPAQALMNRTLKSTIPTTPQRLTPTLLDHEEFIARRQTDQRKQKEYYDRNAQPQLPHLQEGEIVRMKKTPESTWEPAKVVSKHQTPRSYVVQAENGTSYRRNRRHLLKLKGNYTYESPTEEYSDETQSPVLSEESTEKEHGVTDTENQALPEGTRISSFGRIIKPNPRYT